VDILRLCGTSKRIDSAVCQNENFWRNKLYKTYPFARKLQEKYPITNFKKFYADVDKEVKFITRVPEKIIDNTFNRPSFIKQNLVDFFLYSDFGLIPGTDVPLNYILWPILQKGVISRSISTILLSNHLRKYIFIDHGKKYFRVSPEMELYLGNYITDLESKEERAGNVFDARGNLKVPFSKGKFVYNKIPSILSPGFIQGSRLESFEFLTENIYNKVTEVRNKIDFENRIIY
jgi:hypothetical protein